MKMCSNLVLQKRKLTFSPSKFAQRENKQANGEYEISGLVLDSIGTSVVLDKYRSV